MTARMRRVDLVREASASIGSRFGRSLLTSAGTVVGVAAFVASTGLASSARSQVAGAFDRLRATEVTVEDTEPDGLNPFPADLDARLERLNGVRSAGFSWPVTGATINGDMAPTSTSGPFALQVLAVSPGAIDASLPTFSVGRSLHEGDVSDGHRVAVLGRNAAAQLGIDTVVGTPAVFLNGYGYVVVGIIDEVRRTGNLIASIMVPFTAAERDFPTAETEYSATIDVDPGAAQVVGAQAPLALRPDQPERLRALVPPEPRQLRDSIEGDVTNLLYGLAVLGLLVGTIGIANATFVSVLERRGEIGIRTALGARRRDIAVQFLVETGALGGLGGVVGCVAGIWCVVAVAAVRDWTATLDLGLVSVAPLVGVLTGLIAGAVPASRAARIPPVEALRA